ncbi:hypothetical protein WJX77_005422 [Trebouxia sp. C0004]
MEASIDQDTPAASAPTNEGISNAHSEQHRLLMTRDRMNLASVRVRAQDLQKTIMQAIFDLETAPERYDWPNVLERFAVMNAQLHSINGQMVPLMEHYVVHPKAVDQQTAPVLPIMLASKLLPEQDEQQAKQLQDLQQLQGPSASRQAAYVQGMTDCLNRLVDSLFSARADNSAAGMLDPVKGQLRWEIAHTSCVPPKKAPTSGQRVGATQASANKLEGPDLFLAIATNGHGLPRPV